MTDTHTIVKKLVGHGMDARLAEDFAGLFAERDHTTVTKDYLDNRLAGLKSELLAEMAKMEARLFWKVGVLVLLGVLVQRFIP